MQDWQEGETAKKQGEEKRKRGNRLVLGRLKGDKIPILITQLCGMMHQRRQKND